MTGFVGSTGAVGDARNASRRRGAVRVRRAGPFRSPLPLRPDRTVERIGKLEIESAGVEGDFVHVFHVGSGPWGPLEGAGKLGSRKRPGGGGFVLGFGIGPGLGGIGPGRRLTWS